jgi:hypothetical protein
MNAREVEAVAADLARSRRRIREALIFGAACLVLALATAPIILEAAAAFAAGAVTGVLIATLGMLSRQGRIARLAVDPLAHHLPEVARYAERFATHPERERLADWIVEMLRDATSVPDHWYLTGRVLRYADELAALGADLSDPRAEIRPASAAAVHLLLTQAVDSPLYNPALPADQLPLMIARIRLGITRSPV